MSVPPPFPSDECLHVPGLEPQPGHAVYLGLIEYGEAWRLQLALVDAVLAGRAPDLLLLCQHPDVITVGRRQKARDNILSARFPTFEVERGGDATYHGPGQLVGYPILKLRPSPAEQPSPSERDLHRYLRALEGGLIDLCAHLGVPAGRKPGATGVWTLPNRPAYAADRAATQPADGTTPAPLGQHKLASMGIAVRRWVTFHGFALNVTTDLSRFFAINPCGFQAEVMTSLAALQAEHGSIPTVLDTVPLAIEHLGARLHRRFTLASSDGLAALCDPAPAVS